MKVQRAQGPHNENSYFTAGIVCLIHAGVGLIGLLQVHTESHSASFISSKPTSWKTMFSWLFKNNAASSDGSTWKCQLI